MVSQMPRSITSPPLSLRIQQAKHEFSLSKGAGEAISSGRLNEPGNEQFWSWINSERTLTSRLLLWCNQPFYRGLTLEKPLTSLEQASLVVGSRELKRLAIIASIRDLFLPDLQIDCYRRERLWNHSIAVGAVGSMISKATGQANPGIVFFSGVLHDIGLCAHERLAPDEFERVISLVDELSAIHMVERELMGWDHGELGAGILEQWGLPEQVAAVARYHHDPDPLLDGPHGATLACVVVANYFCSRAGWSTLGPKYLAPPSARLFAFLGIDSSLLTSLWRQVDSTLELVTDFR